jgi:putative membrane protein
MPGRGIGAIIRAMSWHWMDGWGWAMMAFGILFWAAVIGLVIWAVGEWSRRREQESAREILDQRFARGELDLDAYTSAVEALSRRDRPATG